MKNPFVETNENGIRITKKGEALLREIVTDPYGSVYAFTGRADSQRVAAAMARLSRSPNDMREIYLHEFAHHEEKADDLIKRVVTSYGDDSVQQLLSLSVVVESTSNLMTKLLEWARIGVGYLEQSTRYIYFDQRNKQGQYKYFVPEFNNLFVAQNYRTHMDTIFDSYSRLSVS